MFVRIKSKVLIGGEEGVKSSDEAKTYETFGEIKEGTIHADNIDWSQIECVMVVLIPLQSPITIKSYT